MKEYHHAMFRRMNILDNSKLGDVLINKVLAKKSNVKFKYNTQPTKYDIDPQTKHVKDIHLNNNEKLSCDFLVLCNGPDAGFHIWDHFRCVLPMLHG